MSTFRLSKKVFHNKLKVFGQAFFKRLAGQGRSPVADETSAKCFTECVPHRVNLKIVQWTIFKEGHALQERAAPKNKLYIF